MDEPQNEPIHLIEDEDTGDRFLVYGTDQGMRLDIRFEGETLWMTQAQIADLFGRDVSTISRHISNIFEEGELDETNSLQKVQTIRRPAVVYNLDVVISVGYRVSSAQATTFRRWATGVLVQYARKGFVVDSIRLKNPENSDRIRELREIIRDIRSDEANVHRELKQICAMCQDYDPKSVHWSEFYKTTQAKLIYAVTTNTPAEIIYARSDASKPDMGLTNWQHDNIRQTDVTISKNYLAEGELRELNRLTSIILDIFEDQFDLGRISTMLEVEQELDSRLASLGRAVLRGGGSVRKAVADERAKEHFAAFKEAKKLARHREADQDITELTRQSKALPRSRGPRQG